MPIHSLLSTNLRRTGAERRREAGLLRRRDSLQRRGEPPAENGYEPPLPSPPHPHPPPGLVFCITASNAATARYSRSKLPPLLPVSPPLAVPIRSAKEIDGLRTVCRLAREILDCAAAVIRPGITTDEIDRVVSAAFPLPLCPSLAPLRLCPSQAAGPHSLTLLSSVPPHQVHEATVERKAYPSPLNYYNFPKSVCTSVNEVICHGIPDLRELQVSCSTPLRG